MAQATIVQPLVDKPLFDPTYLNLAYVFNRILEAIQPVISFFTDPKTWSTIGLISSLLSVVCIAIIIFSLVRMREIQLHEKEEIEHEINHALAKQKEGARKENPRWHYVITLVESPNESDWRVAILEADTMLDEILTEKGYAGETLGEKLELLRSGGLSTIQYAWDAHLVRNQIAHTGSDYSLTQNEARRVVKMFGNVFGELGVI